MKLTFERTLHTMLIILFCGITNPVFCQSTITGEVTDGETGEVLIGANVLIKGTNKGTTTNFDGRFEIDTDQALPLDLLISYTGYTSKTVEVTQTEGMLAISLDGTSLIGQEIVVSASRRKEKVQEAPAAISIVNSTKIISDAVSNPFLSLRNTVGVDVQQAGIDGGHITLRGANAVFQTETFVMADYRNLVLPGLGTIGYSQQPVDAIDLDRVEIIKGPGSALYGPGVESGIVHFISKSPIEYPGTTVSVGGGNRSVLQSSIRHAAVNKDKTFGYKILGYYRQGRDWELDPNDAVDAAQLATFQDTVFDSQGEVAFTEVPDYDVLSIGVTGTLEFRPNSNTSVIATGGWSKANTLYRTGSGTGFSKIPRPFAQVRLQTGGLFAQAFWSNNAGIDGRSGLYGSGQTGVNNAQQLEGQLQYNFDLADEKISVTTGADYRLNTVETARTVHGRFENDDDYSIFGAYAQAEIALAPKLDLILAGRVDRFTALKQNSFSPRAALVYKPDPKHTFRATWNKAIGAPSSLNLYADLPLADNGAFLIHLIGGAVPISFDNVSTSSFLPGAGENEGVGLPVANAYAVATGALAGTLPPELIAYLNSQIPNVTGFSTGVMTAAPVVRDELKLSESNMIEVGYKGLIADKLSVGIDIYYNQRNNMLSAPVVASPLVVQPFLGTDLANAITNTADPAVLANFGLSVEALAGIYESVGNSIAFNDEGTPNVLGLIQSDQAPNTFNVPTLDLSYYNIAQLDYAGIDLSLQYYFSNDLSVYGSASYLTENFFEDIAVGEGENASTTDFSFNIPDKKFKLGINYQPELGFNGNFSFRYQSAFDAINGTPFTGPVDAFNMVDIGLGYNFNSSIGVNVSVTNLLEEDYRYIYGAPVIGRQIMGRATYNF